MGGLLCLWGEVCGKIIYMGCEMTLASISGEKQTSINGVSLESRKDMKNMLPPRKVKFEAQKKERENLEFRSFLKCNADEKELDEQFSKLHEELFANYDCNRCRNCCKMFHGSIPVAVVEKGALHLETTVNEFIELYLDGKDSDGNYQTKHKPCDFLQVDGSCKLGDCKPESCKKYPYTNQPERLRSLYSVLDTVAVCPVAFEIYERLKKEYGFKK